MGNKIKCDKCGLLLATFSGELGLHRRLKFAKNVRVLVEKNALGEDLGWARCPKCRSQSRVDAAYLPGNG